MSISHWGMFAIGYYVHETDPANPWLGRARYVHTDDPDYCPTGVWGW